MDAGVSVATGASIDGSLRMVCHDTKELPHLNVIIIVTRHPDFSNEFETFVDEPNLVTVDVDYGRRDLRDRQEFGEWANDLTVLAGELDLLGSRAASDAARRITELVVQARDDYQS